VDLVPMEYRVLEYLASRSRAVVSKTELLAHSTATTGRSLQM
jgi:DNA-binding winged helix-turn-helix (wHTH) protein